jgi:hypothetical protein
MAEGGEDGIQMQGSRVSIRPQRSGFNSLSDRPHSASPSSYSQFGARGGKFSSAKPKSDVEWAIYRAKQCPGPGEYKTNKDFIPRGGRFNLSKPKSDIDWIIKKSSEEPGPGDYKVDLDAKTNGGRFSTARPKSALEWTIFNARQRPGPGHYNPDAHHKVNGGRFSSAKPKSDVEWSMYRAKQQPGPGQYQIRKDVSLPGGKFNMSNPKSDVDWAILRSSQRPSPQDYLPDGHYKVVGGRFSQSRPRSALDWEIHRSKQVPGPGEYNAELQSISRRSGLGYSPSNPSLPHTARPKSAEGIPPEARGKVRPKSGMNETSTDSLYGIGNNRPKRPSTSLGIPPEARRKPKPQSSIPPEARGQLPPRASSAPPGPRMATSPKSRPETPSEQRERQEVHVKIPNARTGSGSTWRNNDKVYVGGEPTIYRQTESSRPSSVLESKFRTGTRSISTQASEEDMVRYYISMKFVYCDCRNMNSSWH